jgi:transcription antitermination factor NusG
MLRTEVGIEVFCPFLRFERARRTGRTWVTEAMFPGYVFARFPYITEFRHIRATSGVVNVVTFGGLPSVVPDGIIADLRAGVKDEETIEIHSTIGVGDEVQVLVGAFQGVRALVTRVMPARERVAVLLEMLGMEREVEVAARDVLPDIPHPLSPQKR